MERASRQRLRVISLILSVPRLFPMADRPFQDRSYSQVLSPENLSSYGGRQGRFTEFLLQVSRACSWDLQRGGWDQKREPGPGTQEGRWPGSRGSSKTLNPPRGRRGGRGARFGAGLSQTLDGSCGGGAGAAAGRPSHPSSRDPS